MELDFDRFEVRLASGPDDIRAAQALRYRVFVEELGAVATGADHDAKLEKDAFDPFFDHILLLDRSKTGTEKVAGAFRVMSDAQAKAGKGFYSAAEFDLHNLTSSGRKLLEMGRSCLAPEYRGGVALQMMWHALATYVLERDIEILFGVASFHGQDPEPIADALRFLNRRHLADPDLQVTARDDGFLGLDDGTTALNRDAALVQLPALIKSYLRLGGVVGSSAYIDKDFNTIDVCLILDTLQMSARFKDRFTAPIASQSG